MSKDLRTKIGEARTYYDSIGRVYCKILNSYVYFSSEGRRHILYRRNRKKRPVKEQWYKLNLLPLSIPVLKNADNIESWRFPENSKSDDQFYALVWNVGRQKIPVRVIVKRTGDGQFNFHSIMEHRTKKPRI